MLAYEVTTERRCFRSSWWDTQGDSEATNMKGNWSGLPAVLPGSGAECFPAWMSHVKPDLGCCKGLLLQCCYPELCFLMAYLFCRKSSFCFV